MEEGIDDHVIVGVREADGRAPDIKSVDILGMAGHHPLGLAGGAGGEEDIQRIPGLHCRHPRLQYRGIHAVARGQEILPGLAALALTGKQHARLEGRQVFSRQHRGIAHAQEVTHCEQPARAAGAKNKGRLAALEPGVQGYQHAPHTLGANSGDDPLHPVGRPDRDALAVLQARGNKGPGRPLASRIQLGIGHPQVAIHHGQMLGQARRGLRDNLGHGALGVVGHCCLCAGGNGFVAGNTSSCAGVLQVDCVAERGSALRIV